MRSASGEWPRIIGAKYFLKDGEWDGVKYKGSTYLHDRDMPIKFLPIKWEKLLLKLDAAQKAGVEKAITFEFSHFLSPNSAYLQARHLYRRYCEHFGLGEAAARFA